MSVTTFTSMTHLLDSFREDANRAQAEASRQTMALIKSTTDASNAVMKQAADRAKALVAEAAKNDPAAMSAAATASAIKSADQMDRAAQASLDRDLERLLGPGGAQAVAQQAAKANRDLADYTATLLPLIKEQAAHLVRGEIPNDVEAVVRNSVGERAWALLGGRSESRPGVGLLARDLGLTSLDMQERGRSMAQTGSQIAMQPLTAAASLADMTKAFLAPRADASALYGMNMQTATSLAGQRLDAAWRAGSMVLDTAMNSLRLNTETAASMYNAEANRAQSTWNTLTTTAASMYDSAATRAQQESQFAREMSQADALTQLNVQRENQALQLLLGAQQFGTTSLKRTDPAKDAYSTTVRNLILGKGA